MSTSTLDVYLHQERAGKLERLSQAKLQFTYDPAWVENGAAALSLCLPVRPEPFSDEECRPFFEGLLPEGEFLRAVSRAFHVSAGNPFALLGEIGGECAGAVSLMPVGSPPPVVSASAPAPTWLSEAGLAKLLDELPGRPLLAGSEEGIRLSLAGSQDKLPVLHDGERVGITRGAPPSTHIVKTPIAGLADTVANEAFCMRLATHAGLVAAQVEPGVAEGREYLMVWRYDRESKDGAVERIHQEDLCQALGFSPALKYQGEGGPGVAQCAALLRARSAAPAVDLLAFLDALVFNFTIGNHDAHTKNYSLLLEGRDAPRLAPLYDLVSTRVYTGLHKKLAMKYGGEYRPNYVRGRHLDRLAADLEMSPRVVRDRARQVANRVREVTSEARESLPEPWRGKGIIDTIVKLVEERTKTIRDAAGESG